MGVEDCDCKTFKKAQRITPPKNESIARADASFLPSTLRPHARVCPFDEKQARRKGPCLISKEDLEYERENGIYRLFNTNGSSSYFNSKDLWDWVKTNPTHPVTREPITKEEWWELHDNFEIADSNYYAPFAVSRLPGMHLIGDTHPILMNSKMFSRN